MILPVNPDDVRRLQMIARTKRGPLFFDPPKSALLKRQSKRVYEHELTARLRLIAGLPGAAIAAVPNPESITK